MLWFKHLVAVNSCGLQVKKSNFHRSTVKSRNGQIWKFLFEGFDLVHSSSLNHIGRFWDLHPGQQVLAKFRFSPFSRPIYKNIYAQNCSRPMGSVYLDFRLPWPSKFAVGTLSPGKWWPFEIMLPIIWITHIFDRIYLGFPSIKLNDFFTKTKEAIFVYNVLASLTFGGHWA